MPNLKLLSEAAVICGCNEQTVRRDCARHPEIASYRGPSQRGKRGWMLVDMDKLAAVQHLKKRPRQPRPLAAVGEVGNAVP